MSYLKKLYSIEKAHDKLKRETRRVEKADGMPECDMDTPEKRDWTETWDLAFERASAKLLKEELARKDARIETLLKRIDLYHDIIVGLHSDRGF